MDNYQSVFERAPVGIYQSAPGGRLLSANPALARILGFASPEALLQKWNDGGFSPYKTPGRRD